MSDTKLLVFEGVESTEDGLLVILRLDTSEGKLGASELSASPGSMGTGVVSARLGPEMIFNYEYDYA